MADPMSKSWNTKHYILAALGGTLAAAAIVIVVSVILRPAQITFSVERATRTDSGGGGGEGLYLNVSIAAATTSRRAKVRYQSVFVDVQNTTNPAVTDAIIHLKNDTALRDEYLGPRDDGRPQEIVNASVLLVRDSLGPAFAGEDLIGGGKLVVVVTAQVRFKVGVAKTRLFDVQVYCRNVAFVRDVNATRASNPVICKA